MAAWVMVLLTPKSPQVLALTQHKLLIRIANETFRRGSHSIYHSLYKSISRLRAPTVGALPKHDHLQDLGNRSSDRPYLVFFMRSG